MTKIRIRHGDNEIELEGSTDFIKKHLADFYSRIQSPNKEADAKRELRTTVQKKKPPLTPAEYYKGKGKTDGVSQILIFAKYLEEYRGVSEFSPREINDLALKEVKLSKEIHPQFYSNAVKAGLLRTLGGGKYTLTLSAEEALSAM